MTWRLDGGELMSEARVLRRVAAGIDATASSICYALGRVGRSSGSTATLASQVDSLFGRAADFDARAAMLEDLAFRYAPQQLVSAVAGRSANLTIESQLSGQISRLDSRITNWNGTDNDPILDALVRDRHAMVVELQAERERAYRAAVDEAANLVSLRSQGSWAEVSYRSAIAEADRLAASLAATHGVQLTPATASQVVTAMELGLTPTEANLPEFVFPPAYVERMHELSELRREQAFLDGILLDAEVTWDSLDREYAQAVFSYDSTVDMDDLFDRLIVAGDRLGDLEAEAKALSKEISKIEGAGSLAAISEYVSGVPFLTAPQRSEMLGTYLAVQAESLAHSDAPIGDQVVLAEELIGLLPPYDEIALTTFFENLGPENTATIAALTVQELRFSDHIEVLADRLALASHGLAPTFGAELVTAWTFIGYQDQRFAYIDWFWTEYQVGTVFEGSPMNYEFLVAAYDEMETQYAGYDLWVLPTEDTQDPRARLLSAISRHPEFNVVAFLTPERVVPLFDDDYADDGVALGEVLELLGDSDGDGSAVRATIGTVISRIATLGEPLQIGTAYGAAGMIEDHLSAFIPVQTWDGAAEAFVGGPIHPNHLQMEREDLGVDQLQMRQFLEWVMRHDYAAARLMDITAAFVRSEIETFEDLHDLETRSDELAFLIGYVADIAGDIAIERGRDQDDANAFKQLVAKTMMSAVVTGSFVLSGGSGLVVAAPVKWVVGQAIGHGTSAFAKELWPTDAEISAVEGRLEDLASADLTQYQYLALASVYDESPELFVTSSIPDGLLDGDHLIRPGDQTEYHGYSVESIDTMWSTWMEQDLFVDQSSQLHAILHTTLERMYGWPTSSTFGSNEPITSS